MQPTFSRRDFLKFAGAAGVAALIPRLTAKQLTAKQWTATGHAFTELAGFDSTLSAYMQARNITGGALAVTRNGRLVLARGYTYTDDSTDLTVQPTSLFRIASISKPLTSATVMRLIQEGRLHLTDKVSQFLTFTPITGQTVDPRLGNVTIRQLLQHLGGWDRDLTFDPMFRDPLIAATLGVSLPINRDHIRTYMAGQSLSHVPGSTYSYSNFGYLLLGQVIEAVTGKPYEEVVRQKILNPLGILRPTLGHSLLTGRLGNEVKYHSQYNRPTVFNGSGLQTPAPYGGFNLENMQSHGAWLSSAVDLVRFAASFDTPAASPILSAASISATFGLPENIAPASYVPGSWYYACGWAVRDWGGSNRNTWHDGSLDGTYTLLVRRGSDATNWCVLFNQRDDPSGFGYADIDDQLHAAANAVSAWPTHDLFSEYLSTHTTYMPKVMK